MIHWRHVPIAAMIGALTLSAWHCQPTPSDPEPEQTYTDLVRAFSAAVVTPAVPSGPKPPTTELVLTESFEDASSNTRWGLNQWAGTADGRRTETESFAGNHSYVISDREGTTPAGAAADISRIVAVEPMTRYRFVGHVRTENLETVDGSPSSYGSFYLVEDGATAVTRFHTHLPDHEGTSPGWQLIDYTFTTSGFTSSLMIGASLATWGRATGRVFIDDIQLWKDTAPGTLIAREFVQVGSYSLAGTTRRSLAVPLPSAIDYRLRVPDDAVLDFAVGVPPAKQAMEGHVVRFRVLAVDSDGNSRQLWQRVVAPADGWVEEQLPSAQLASGDVKLSLRAENVSPDGEGLGLRGALWGHPRIHRPTREKTPPSVLWVSIDTLRADHLGCYGYERDTSPNLDRLAREGAWFAQAQATSSWTLPSHASMLTGTFASHHGADDEGVLAPGLTTAAEVMSLAGYFGGAFTTHIYVSETYGLNRGFDTFQHADINATTVVDRAIGWLRRHRDQPTFLFLHLFDVHADYRPPAPYHEMFTDPGYTGTLSGTIADLEAYKQPTAAPDAADLQHLIDLYDGGIRYVDTELGRLFSGLRALGLDRRTITIITSDHGEEFRDHDSMEHGHTLYEEQLHVPLIIHGPGIEPTEVNGTVRTIDILPTLVDLLDLPHRNLAREGGVSLLDRMGGDDAPQPPNPALAKLERWGGAMYSMRVGDDKLIIDENAGTVQLFELADDPGEKVDLALQKPDAVRRFRAELRSRRARLLELAAEARTGDVRSVTLSEKEKERLRALGYLR